MLSPFVANRWIVALAFGLLSVSAAAGTPKAVEPVDINRATVTELLRVPGITPGWAVRIVRFRPYRTKLDLVQQGVVSAEVYQRIRDGVIAHRVTTGDATGKNPR